LRQCVVAAAAVEGDTVPALCSRVNSVAVEGDTVPALCSRVNSVAVVEQLEWKL